LLRGEVGFQSEIPRLIAWIRQHVQDKDHRPCGLGERLSWLRLSNVNMSRAKVSNG
jgi:hypothetical protein